MRFFKTIAVSLLLAMGSLISLQAQNRAVSGKVLDEQQQPVIGAAVMVAGGASIGAVTDNDGSFTLNVPSGDVVLEVSCLGYVSKNVTVPSTLARVTVNLEEDKMLLEETVVVGYGTQKKVNLTGAISVVDNKQLQDRSSHNLVTMLQGSVPGLNITTQSGNPGSTGKLNIRGFTSINNSDDGPIVLIDGAIGDLEDVNPNDVESISVIKDASAAAVYGARAAFGVILVTTKKGADADGKAKIRYSGKFGWEEPTTSTDYESRGYWSVYTLDLFWKTQAAGSPYTGYTDHDMMELLARVNDKTEDPSRPWVVTEVRNGREQWIYYCNTDWYHEMFNDRHPVQQHSISISGGSKNIKYFISGGYDRQTGIIKPTPDVFTKYNLRAKIDAKLNKWLSFSNNSSFYSSNYSYIGVGDIQDVFRNLRHTPASFPLFNPDGTGLYNNPLIIGGNYNVANGRQIVFYMGKHQNSEKKFNFANTSSLVIAPIKQFNITADFTYRRVQRNDMHRTVNIPYGISPGVTSAYTSGAGLDQLTEQGRTYDYLSGNVFATYADTFKDAHNLKVMLGFNAETYHYKNVTAVGQNLSDEYLNDLSLVVPDESGATITSVTGGQSEYALMGFFGRINYDYKGRYLFELAGRYDGSSRFSAGHRWGFFPSGSAGWRISEEPFFEPAKKAVSNLKLRASVGSLGNQNVDNYAFMRTIEIKTFSGYTFGEGTNRAQYANLTAPNSSSLTWETTYQYNVGLDASFFNNRLDFTAEAYIRDTKNMLVQGNALPSVYGADAPKENSADLRTRGYELSIGWRDGFKLAGHPFNYNVRASLSDYDSYITRYDNNPDKRLTDYYVGQRIGDIWGFVVDGLFATDEEAQNYQNNVCDALTYIGTNRMQGGFLAGDLRYVDLDNKQEG
ncbi:MAG: SusC/RagA family TonB-linked outer membrane protein, partial [Candidatus Cryptobacteroides sp.]